MAVSVRQMGEKPVAAHSARELVSLLRTNPLVEVRWKFTVYHGSLEEDLQFKQKVLAVKDIVEGDEATYFGQHPVMGKWAGTRAYGQPWNIYKVQVKPGTVLTKMTFPNYEDELPFLNPDVADGGVMWIAPGWYGMRSGGPNKSPNYGIALEIWNVDKLEITDVRTVRLDYIDGSLLRDSQ